MIITDENGRNRVKNKQFRQSFYVFMYLLQYFMYFSHGGKGRLPGHDRAAAIRQPGKRFFDAMRNMMYVFAQAEMIFSVC